MLLERNGTMDKQTPYVGAPTHCDVCNKAITKAFVDGKTTMGPWANMCLACHDKHGYGLGTGKGQLFRKMMDGHFYKEMG